MWTGWEPTSAWNKEGGKWEILMIFPQITESSNKAKAWKGSGFVKLEFGISRAGPRAPSSQPQINPCLPALSLALGAGFLPTSLLGEGQVGSKSFPRE